MQTLYDIVTAARQLRNEYGIAPKQSVQFVIVTGAFTGDDCATIKSLIGECEVTVTGTYTPQGVTPSLVTKAGTIFMVGAVDAEQERQRLTKQLADIEKQLTATEAKLANENFVQRAAPVAVQREREKLATLREQQSKINALLIKLI